MMHVPTIIFSTIQLNIHDKETAAITAYHEAVEYKQNRLNQQRKIVSINNFRR